MSPINSLNGSILPMSTMLPPVVRDALAAASKLESRLDFGECDERAAAVDKIVADAKQQYPQYFQ